MDANGRPRGFAQDAMFKTTPMTPYSRESSSRNSQGGTSSSADLLMGMSPRSRDREQRRPRGGYADSWLWLTLVTVVVLVDVGISTYNVYVERSALAALTTTPLPPLPLGQFPAVARVPEEDAADANRADLGDWSTTPRVLANVKLCVALSFVVDMILTMVESFNKKSAFCRSAGNLFEAAIAASTFLKAVGCAVSPVIGRLTKPYVRLYIVRHPRSGGPGADVDDVSEEDIRDMFIDEDVTDEPLISLAKGRQPLNETWHWAALMSFAAFLDLGVSIYAAHFANQLSVTETGQQDEGGDLLFPAADLQEWSSGPIILANVQLCIAAFLVFDVVLTFFECCCCQVRPFFKDATNLFQAAIACTAFAERMGAGGATLAIGRTSRPFIRLRKWLRARGRKGYHYNSLSNSSMTSQSGGPGPHFRTRLPGSSGA